MFLFPFHFLFFGGFFFDRHDVQIAYPPHPSSQMRGDREAAETVRESAVQLSVLARLISVDGDSPNHSPYLA